MNDTARTPRDIYNEAILRAQARHEQIITAANAGYAQVADDLQRDYDAQEESAWQKRQIAAREARTQYDQEEKAAWQRYCDTVSSTPLEMTP